MFKKTDKISQLKKLSAIKADDSWVHSTKYELLSEIDSQNRLMKAMRLTRAEKLDMYFSRMLKNVVPTFITALSGNHPNPFNPETKIEFSLSEGGNTSLEIYNVKGQKVKTLVNDKLDPGKHFVIWNGKDDNNRSVSSGIYFYKMKAAKFTSTKKMILMK